MNVRELTLYDHIWLGNRGETSVKGVNLSGGEKSLKNEAAESKNQQKFGLLGNKVRSACLSTSLNKQTRENKETHIISRHHKMNDYHHFESRVQCSSIVKHMPD